MSTVADVPAGDGLDRFDAGEPVLVGDPGDPMVFVVAAAAQIDGARLERVQELAGGITVLGLASAHARRLRLDPLLTSGDGAPGLALTAPVDAATGIRGGWSARDRARTMRTVAAPGAVAEELRVPGHVHTARIASGSTPAALGALELSRRAGRLTAVVLGTVSDREGAPVALHEARSLAALRRLPLLSSAQLRARALAERAGGRTVSCELPTREAHFRAIALDLPDGGATGSPLARELPGGGAAGSTVALVHGDPAARERPLVHVHVACMLGDALGSRACRCRQELDGARDEILAAGAGVIVHVAPATAELAMCARETPIDLAPVLALLGACGIDAAAILQRPS